MIAQFDTGTAVRADYPLWGPLASCGHCGRAGAEAWVGGLTWSARLCHPNDPSLPDCYRRVSVYREPVGALLGVDPKPAGVDAIIGGEPDPLRLLELAASASPAPLCPCGHGEDDLCLNGAIYGSCGDPNCGGGCDPDAGTCRSLPGCCEPRP